MERDDEKWQRSCIVDKKATMLRDIEDGGQPIANGANVDSGEPQVDSGREWSSSEGDIRASPQRAAKTHVFCLSYFLKFNGTY